MSLYAKLAHRSQSDTEENQSTVLTTEKWLSCYALFDAGTTLPQETYQIYQAFCEKHELLAESYTTFVRKVAKFGVEKKLTINGYIYTIRFVPDK